MRRADLLYAPVVEQTYPVAHDQRFFLIMRYIHDAGASFPGKAAYLDLHMVAQSLVQSAQRLVHEDNRRFVDEDSSQCHTLLLAPRDFARKPLEPVGQNNGKTA